MPSIYNYEYNKKNNAYVKESIHMVNLKFKNEEYYEDLLPCIERSGMKVATFIKEAIREKIERDGLR